MTPADKAELTARGIAQWGSLLAAFILGAICLAMLHEWLNARKRRAWRK